MARKRLDFPKLACALRLNPEGGTSSIKAFSHELSLSLPGAASDPDRRLQLRAPASIDVRGLKPEAGAVKQSPGGSAWVGTAQVETRVLKLNVEPLKG